MTDYVEFNPSDYHHLNTFNRAKPYPETDLADHVSELDGAHEARVRMQDSHEPHRFATSDYLAASDYTGGSLCKANIIAWEERFADEQGESWDIVTGAYCYRAVVIDLRKVTEDMRDCLAALCGYPVVCEDTLSHFELKAEDDALENGGYRDIAQELSRHFDGSDVSEDYVKENYHEWASQADNGSWCVHEVTGAYIDARRIVQDITHRDLVRKEDIGSVYGPLTVDEASMVDAALRSVLNRALAETEEYSRAARKASNACSVVVPAMVLLWLRVHCYPAAMVDVLAGARSFEELHYTETHHAEKLRDASILDIVNSLQYHVSTPDPGDYEYETALQMLRFLADTVKHPEGVPVPTELLMGYWQNVAAVRHECGFRGILETGRSIEQLCQDSEEYETILEVSDVDYAGMAARLILQAIEDAELDSQAERLELEGVVSC